VELPAWLPEGGGAECLGFFLVWVGSWLVNNILGNSTERYLAQAMGQDSGREVVRAYDRAGGKGVERRESERAQFEGQPGRPNSH